MMAQQPGSGRCSLAGLKLVVLLLAFSLSIYIVGPPLYWQLVEAVAALRHPGSCPPCFCDCPTDNASTMPPGFGNTSHADCGNVDPSVHEELDKNSVELLTEELKLKEAVAKENEQRADSALLDAKKLASQYQKEAEKCSSGMETCEEAREKSESALAAQKKICATWEQRARDMGWQEAGETAKRMNLA